ncbi:LysM peptidoglycan-binding domain-containing protein [Ornithinimicrobium pratense]|uniref:Bacterial transcriptional activator domain-containing protein n=1 Tax=Ornithinimicrobium pratense TaxID=2593973 RepID=A0A5J6V2A7_9MICO|nr:hypothetical protein [Ornithinimicrobium pratense]QFG67434.1 hypothetical protein FY030_00685 [Ornithinimicrobium pratense]
MSTTTPRRPDRGAKTDKGGGASSAYRPRTAEDHLPRPPRQERAAGAGALSLLGILLLVVGVPAALVYFVGNPLPTSAPSTSWLTAPITSDALINIVAALIWVVWAHFVVCLVAEWRAARAGRLPHLVPAGGGSQLLARRLVAGVLLLAGTATATGTMPGQQEPTAVVTTDAGASASSALANLEGPGASVHSAVQRAGEATGQVAQDAAGLAAGPRAEAQVTKFYEVKPPEGRNYDTLWDISERTLGDPFRYKEIYELNKERVQPDGRRLVDADLIQPGWQLVMPADASGPAITAVRAHLPFTSTPLETDTAAVVEAGTAAGETGIDLGSADGAGDLQAGAATGSTLGASGAVHADETRAGAGQDGAGMPSALAGQPARNGVDLGDLTLGGGMILAGLALALSTRRGPYGDPSTQEEALLLAGTPGRAALLDLALRVLAEGRAQQQLPLPDPTAVYVNDEQVLVHLAGSGHAAPPAPWREVEDGRVWSVRREDLAGLQPAASAPWPALVNIAVSHGFDLLVDLEAAPGLVSIGGEVSVAREVAFASVVDLLTHPWSDGVQVTLVGFAGADALADLAPGRVHAATSLEDVLGRLQAGVAEREELTRRLGVDGVLAGRLAGAGADLRPHVVVLSGQPGAEEAQRLTQLLTQGRNSLAAVCVGQTLAARWRFTVDGGGLLDLGALGLSGSARRLRHEDLSSVAHWLRDASEAATQATGTVAAMGPQEAVSTLPQAGAGHVRTAGAMHDRSRALAHVRLLGPVQVQAPHQVDPAREALLTELVCLVALHPGGVHESVLRVSLWPRGVEDDVVEATLAAAIRWLGTDPQGVPLLARDDEGRWRLSPAVHVDWLELAAAAQQHADDPQRLGAVLAQARGEMFSATPADRYRWLAFHAAARDGRVVATAAARRAAAAQAGAGDSTAAEQTLRSGLTLVPRSQALWRDLLRLLGGHDPDTASRVAQDMTTVLADDGFEPETAALVGHLAPAARESG